MKEYADYVKVREDNYASQRDILKVTTGWEHNDGRREGHDSEAYEDYTHGPGVIRWASNDRCIPLDICRRMHWYNLEAQSAAIETDTQRLIQDYFRRQEEFEADTSPEAMEMKRERDFERAAAFGPGETVVDCITGKVYRT